MKHEIFLANTFVSGVFFIGIQGSRSINVLERICLALIFFIVQFNTNISYYLCVILYNSIANNTMTIELIDRIRGIQILLCKVELYFIGIIFILMQYWLRNFGNLRRKLFHIVLFYTLMRLSRSETMVLIRIIEVLLYLSVLLQRNRMVLKFIDRFRNENDTGYVIYSHSYLLGCIIVSFYSLEYELFTKSLISLCILDTFTSITKDFKKKKVKNNIDMALGIICANLTHLYLYGSGDLLFYTMIGIIEHKNVINDNISITTISVIYYRNIRK
ncbi:hypothetical protein ECANGB1_1284 [Enterospora canceri]|uniref:Dolichol kinase n=1 Tax=Enterospora canceri TaxID=1081671 RepID=A0A1Y1S6F2_9MICR|nr:hypothetical protein ECANGB1_1284 [Enterospora canceri]